MAPRGNPRKQTGKSRIGGHMGNILIRLSNTYNTLSKTILECIQNAIDANATHVVVVADYQNRDVYVLDNGEGVSEEMFDQALMSIGETQKAGLAGRIGRFGLGLISPLTKCRQFCFTSQSGNAPPIRWTFEEAKIAKQAADIHVPKVNLPSLPTLPSPFQAKVADLKTRWRTLVSMKGLVNDKHISLIDLRSVEDEVRSRFGRVMFERNIHARVIVRDASGQLNTLDIEPKDYTGTPLPVWSCQSESLGKVVVSLYRAHKRGNARNGIITVKEMTNPSGVLWKNFVTQARNVGWQTTDDAFAALSSGYFEGTIESGGITMHPERTKFEVNDHVLELYKVIERWYDEVGRELYDDDRRRTAEERYQELGRRTIDSLQQLLKNDPDGRLQQLMDEFLQLPTGSPGGESDEYDPTKPGDEPGTGPGTTDTGEGGTIKPPGGGGSTGTGGGGPRPGNGRRVGSKGKPAGNPLVGLRIVHEAFEFSQRLWEFYPDEALLGINTDHAIWKELDDSENPKRKSSKDKHVERFQLWLVIEVLTMLSLPQDVWDHVQSSIDLQVKPMIDAIFTVA